MATDRSPGDDCSSGTTSVSKMSPSGSGRRLLREVFFCEGRIGSVPQAIAGRLADPGLGRGHGNGMGLSERHEEPHLLIGDMTARHERSPNAENRPLPEPVTTVRPTHFGRNAGLEALRSGYALPTILQPRVLILIDAGFSSCLSRCSLQYGFAFEASADGFKGVLIVNGSGGHHRKDVGIESVAPF